MQKLIASARSKVYDNYPLFEGVVHYCKLKPISSWKKWSDESGNKINITKNGKIVTYVAKAQLPRYNDLFALSTFETLQRHCKWTLYDGEYIWTLGSADNILRVSRDDYNISPLELGFEKVHSIVESYLITN